MQAPTDLDSYLAALSEDERTEIEIAGASIDLAILLYRAREDRGLTQAAAAAQAGLAQQAVSRLERPPSNVRFDTLRRYLGALGYDLEISIRDPTTDRIAAQCRWPALPTREAEQARTPTEARELVASGAA